MAGRFESMKRLTIFTPTYNRDKLLGRVYESLVMQDSKEFKWLIVDDGSKDNTKSVVEGFIAENKIDITYVYTENGGKMRAHNVATSMCDTELFLCLDSDDWLSEGAVSKLIGTWDKISKSCDDSNHARTNNKPYAGVISHKGKSSTELLSGVEFPDGIESSSLYNLYLNGFKGETTIMFRSDVIRSFPFPEIENEKYVPEDYIYDKIDSEYVYFILPEIITICEIMENGYTDSVKELKIRNKEAFYLYYEQRARITPLSLLKLKYAGFYVKFARLTGKNVFDTKLNRIFVLAGILASKLIKD